MEKNLELEAAKTPSQYLVALSKAHPMPLPFATPVLDNRYRYGPDGQREVVPTMVGEYGKMTQDMLDAID